jgi:anaerobic selenocysteine-containing dehydrogenase
LKKDQEKLPKKEEKEQSGEVSRREFLVGAGTVVVGGAIGAGILSSCGGNETVTTTVEKTKTVTTTSVMGDGEVVTVTAPGGGTVTETVTIGTGTSVEPAFEEETTCINMVGGNTNTAVDLDIKNGKIIRIRGVHWDETATQEELDASYWKYTGTNRKTGETMALEVSGKSDPVYMQYAYKKRIYSPKRIPYPLQRVDWEPGGVNVNAKNRGISKFKRISWDRAAEIIASEIKRVQETYGNYAILDKSDGCHRETKNVQGGSCSATVSGLLQYMGATLSVRNADSWEGWYYGTKHIWGNGTRGAMPSENNLVLDHTLNTDMIIYAGCDWDTTAACGGMLPSRVARWYRHLGIKSVYIAPDMNFQNQSNPDKWIPVIGGRDDAYLLAIIYVWLTEDTWDKDYVDTHCWPNSADLVDGKTAMDFIRAYVMGDDDGVVKTPEWAQEKCGVKAWTIRALARQWASRNTSLDHHLGGAMIRGPYSHECARLWAVCLAMQALGAPGRNQNCTFTGPKYPSFVSLTVGAVGAGSRFAGLGAQVSYPPPAIIKQVIAKTVIPGAILDGHAETWGNTALSAPPEDQFIKWVYPDPEVDQKIHMMWADQACHISCWNDSNSYIQAVRDESIECYVIQQMWFENDCEFADIILPINTSSEERDINNSRAGRDAIIYFDKPIQPVGESKSDMEACALVAEKLEAYGGQYAGIYSYYTGDMTLDDWVDEGFNVSPLSGYISYEELKEKRYYLCPVKEGWENVAPGMLDFYNDPASAPINLPSGLLELYSSNIANLGTEAFGYDGERPPIPHYIPGGTGVIEGDTTGKTWTHDESLDPEVGERCKTYPLIMQSQHCRWRVHGQYDDIPWTREIPSCKVKGYDGYMYEPVWINPVDAEARGIQDGDIVKVFNERGIELAGAYVTSKIIPSTVHMDHGAMLDMINCDPGDFEERETKWVNRGGTGNNISPYPGLSQHAPGMCVSNYLVQVEKVTGEEMQQWREQYSEAFERDYDPRYGILVTAWIDKESTD